MILRNKANSTVYFFDTFNNLIKVYMVNQSGHIVEEGKKINEVFNTPEYYDEITNIIREINQKYPVPNTSNLTILLSDNCVFNNTVSLPMTTLRNSQQAYKTYVTNFYKNYDLLNIVTHKVSMNRQFTTLSLMGVKEELTDKIKECFKNAKIMTDNITFESSSDICGASYLQPKLKNQSYMFLDIKNDKTKFILVNKGRVIGFFNLGIGYSILTNKVCEEDVLLYSPEAELMVVNAKEKANQKTLSVTQTVENNKESDNKNEQDDFDLDFNFDKNESKSSEDVFSSRQLNSTIIKTLPKKVARKLPKFMQYQNMETDEEIQYNNFRIFMRWTLDILKNNDKLLSITKPSIAYVNFPIEYQNLLNLANNEIDENGIKFVHAGIKGTKDVTENLELFGALFSKQYKQSIKF